MATDLLKEQYDDLKEENDRSQRLIGQQKDHLASMQKQATVLKSEIQEKLKVPGGVLKQRGKHTRDTKHIRILKNQLNQETIKFDELMCSNVESRKEIAHLMQQKGLLGNIQEKFNRQLATQRNLMGKLDERFALFFNQRSAAETRNLEMKKSIKMETAQFVRRRTQLKTLITHDATLQTFLETKLQQSLPLEKKEDSKEKKEQQQFQNGVKKLEMDVQGHKTLLEVTGESDLRQIDLVFTENEQKNFSYLRYINELHNRRNMMRNRSEKLKADILSLEEQNRGHDEQNDSHLQELESELETSRCLSLQKQKAELQTPLDQLASAIGGLLEDITQEAVIVNVDNIVHFISVLEESIVNLLMQSNHVEDEQMESAPQNDFDLLSELEGVVETVRG
ncbi:coiled-coil domain-containing protein 114-like [Cyclopterus lumpus]|uniref:coiled-coil domain-containing protein 114-like n=1 Tax=Cyclopterus lumpus TaxID=8103 RepID=UPI001486C663|nr:coiled-coil domain-containing protein 114-like [Cyclopterus lumpus]